MIIARIPQPSRVYFGGLIKILRYTEYVKREDGIECRPSISWRVVIPRPKIKRGTWKYNARRSMYWRKFGPLKLWRVWHPAGWEKPVVSMPSHLWRRGDYVYTISR